MTFSKFHFSVLFLLITLWTSHGLFAQITVTVTDEVGKPLPAAHVSVRPINKSKLQVILTDLNGQATLPVTDEDVKQGLVTNISFLGYLSYTDTLYGGSPMVFQMKPDDVALNNIVVTGEYSPNNPERSVNKVRIIDRKELDAMGAVNLEDALTFETNIRLSRDNVLGSSAGVQGMSGENVKIMIDGVPMIGRQDGNIDLNQINLNDVERVEIIQGPLSVNYGSNALAGTINIITKKGQQNQLEVGAGSYYESVGQYNADVRAGYQKGRHYLGITGGRNFFDGWSTDEKPFTLPVSKPADSSRFLQWNPKEQLFAGFQYRYTAKELNIRPFVNLFNEEIISRGLPRAPYADKAFDQRYETKRTTAGIDASGDHRKSQWKLVSAYNQYQRTKNTVFKDLTTLDEELTSNPEDQDTTQFHSWMTRASILPGKKDRKFRYEVGVDVNIESAKGKRILNGEQTLGDYALFTSAEWKPLEDLVIKPGVRLAYNTSYNPPPVPSLNFRFSPGKMVYRLSYARGFRAPSLKELYFEFVDINHNIFGNEELRAETANNFQFEVNRTMRKEQTMLKLELSGFYNHIRDMITLAQEPNTASFHYVNIGVFRSQGIQAAVSHAYNHLHTSVGFSYIGRQSQLTDSLPSTPIYYSPEYNARMRYEFKRLGGSISLFAKYNGVLRSYQINENGSLNESEIEDYAIIDLTASKYFFQKKLTWTFGVKNLLDIRNINSSGLTAGAHNGNGGSVPVSYGRTAFFSLKYQITYK